MPSNDASGRMPYHSDLRFRSQKSVATSARVLNETIPVGHAGNVMAE